MSNEVKSHNGGFKVPDWLFEFHGHKCPYSVMGYRMGVVALRELGVEKCYDHDLFVFSEMGVGHPQGCMQDGIQASTSATFGKGQMHKVYFGKVAATFYHPEKGAVRILFTNEFMDKLGPQAFFKYRKQGIEPSQVPAEASKEVIDMVLNATEEELFKIERVPDFKFKPVPSSFNKAKCDVCGEYVFERYLRIKDGKHVCLQCSGHRDDEETIYLPI
jgi:formylmethanofuran dehydrogenase subunit E